MNDAALNEASLLISTGRILEARKLLEPIIQADPRNIRAWLLEIETWTDPARKRKLMEACLRFNPGEPGILQALASLSDPLSLPVSTPVIIQASSPSKSQAHSVYASRMGVVGISLVALFSLAVVSMIIMINILVMRCDIPLGPGTCTRVLFIGNSFTFVNDLPGEFAQLARSGGNRTKVDMVAEGGWTLAQHAASVGSLDKIKSAQWDFVVVQEQSQIPAVEQSRVTMMFPAARSLAFIIGQAGATPLFFLTWGHRDGYPENGMGNYASMQAQLNNGYLRIANELAAPIAPVGAAWQMALVRNIGLDLWQPDGSHPSPQGTYLAACVFYATIFRRSPEGLSYTGGLSRDVASSLQSIAASVVLQDTHQWNLP